MDLYSKNLNFFKNVADLIYNSILNEKSNYTSEVEYIKEYDNILVENGDGKCFIHSIYSKDRETDEMLKGIEEETELLIIYGFGCGISVEKIKEKFDKIENIIFIEPDLNLFKKIINIIDVEKNLRLLAGKNVTYVINKTPEEACEIIFSMFQRKINKKVSFLYNISYRTLYKNYYENFVSVFIKSIKRFKANINTQAALVYDEVKNVFSNIYEESVPINNFVGKFKDIPAVIVAGGPSLNKNIEYLRDIKDKALIIAAGNGIKILHEHNIIPHFRMAYDPSEDEYRIFENIDTEVAPLIYTDRLYYKCVKNYKGKKIKFFSSVELFSQYIEDKMNSNYLVLDSGFTIVALVLDMLIKIGINKIIFMGQDLSYTEGAMYAKGSIYDNVGVIDFEKEGFTKMKDINGNIAYTHDGFLGMKYNLEDKIKSHPENIYINATEGGLNIDGTVIKTMKQVFNDDLVKEFDIGGIINDELKNEEGVSERREKLKEAITEFLIELDEMDEINNKRISKLEKLSKNRNKGHKLNRILNDMNYLSKNNEIEKNKLYNQVVNPSISNILYSIYWSFKYDGNDKERQIKSDFRVNLNLSFEIKKLTELIKSVIGEPSDI
ncbi:motility associated factor glycosyltransferase family protein [Clostridium beijerinckii]|uniref:motility associated factor glycosyltransferase family protein n=1 Tax=Clostridium beijerinckii TaxID=1520 RepID=UPI00030381A6|nr:6-hydroxymethylpterin diphosphokinase MptE-like protein [Clostridium beijerinckii]